MKHRDEKVSASGVLASTSSSKQPSRNRRGFREALREAFQDFGNLVAQRNQDQDTQDTPNAQDDVFK